MSYNKSMNYEDIIPAEFLSYERNNGLPPLDTLDRPPNIHDIIKRMPKELSNAMNEFAERQYKEDQAKEKERKAKEEEEKAAQAKEAEPPPPDLGNMIQMLEDLNAIGDLSAMRGADIDNMLSAQAQMLNNLFARTLYKAEKQGYPRNTLELALKIQKQSVETLRVRGGLDYMKSITQHSQRAATVGAPPSPQIVKRTEGSE